ncbi:helix-turn-helix domain-containing protein [Spirosoma pollinicola]|uniref:AraC family transcriptional regulator n=1 Tax=Spirosoma pollinicola TaxID=2057025 RepID=A0A2K8YWS4_9BACT|nr:helix-turn-helix transcriptional regulator [Spirosoma pollinicola]AUD02076.1 AraC family transcriptional regulator [Spirosoma pollinicola]
MKKETINPYSIKSISELHRLLKLSKPEHPLVSVIDFSDITCFSDQKLRSIRYHFYCIALKKDFQGKMMYGQNSYDFDEGVMTFFSPGQVVTTDIADGLKLSGWWLVVHPDFIQGYPVAKHMREYGFFSYAVSEALHLSKKEETVLDFLIGTIKEEYSSAIDQHSQDVITSQIQLLLNYCDRFYGRQFITRKTANQSLLVKLEALLTMYFSDEALSERGLPTVHYVAEQLNLSPTYLSDLLRSMSGQNAQQYIHNHVLEKAKDLLTTTELTVGEIAYQLGFGHTQSFNRLFKNKTQTSPLEYRQSFN